MIDRTHRANLKGKIKKKQNETLIKTPYKTSPIAILTSIGSRGCTMDRFASVRTSQKDNAASSHPSMIFGDFENIGWSQTHQIQKAGTPKGPTTVLTAICCQNFSGQRRWEQPKTDVRENLSSTRGCLMANRYCEAFEPIGFTCPQELDIIRMVVPTPYPNRPKKSLVNHVYEKNNSIFPPLYFNLD